MLRWTGGRRLVLSAPALLAPALLALAACSSSATPATPSSPSTGTTGSSVSSSVTAAASGATTATTTPAWRPASPSTTGPVAGATLALDAGVVGTLAIGTDGRVVEARLIELLGRPDRTTDGPGCELLTPVPRERALFWRDLEVLLTAPSATDPSLTLTGWSLTGRSTPVPARLPHGLTVGTSTGADVRRAEPQAQSYASLGAGLVLMAPSGVQYVLSGEGASSSLVQAGFGIAPCE